MNKLFTLLVFTFLFTTSITAQNTNFWSDVAETEVTKTGERQIKPVKYRTVKLDIEGLKDQLATAPMENNPSKSTLRVALPMPDGTTQTFEVVESPIMEAGLALQLTEIKTYLGKGTDDPTATVRFDWTYKGFHAMIIANDNWTFIDPYHTQTTESYISYYKKHFVSSKYFQCDFDNDIHGISFEEKETLNINSTPESVGEQLRTYRLALACTGEYAQFHGGTVNSVASAFVTTMNRVNGVYENELAMRFILVANNNSLIFLNANSDPFNNNNTGTLIAQGQTEITSIIGNNNYDIGHVFSTGAGGLAGLGVICRNNQKGRGVTGISQPIGDPFDIDYVAHELGHQAGSNHTFNGSTGSCGGFNRNGTTAYEPGSGTTIMAYAGICAPQNIENNSDAYFHTSSFDEIITYTTQSNGNNCPVVTNTGNNAPIVNAGTGGYFIPQSTPFELVGSATDPDGHPMTYCWEQYDLGAQGAPNSPTGNAPLFRSFAPVNTPARTFPQISDIVTNNQTMGEILPSYARTLRFRLTARDNQLGGGGVTYDVVNFSVTANAGPFLVTEPNTNQTVWTEGSIGNVTWDIANTDISPVNCSEVDILLSTDGGYTYTYTLATNVPNTGSYSTLVPLGSSTNQARVRVQASNNIFFDISNQNFTIQAPTAPDYVAFELGDDQTVCGGTDGEYSFLLIPLLNYNDDVTLTAVNVPDGLTANFSANPATPGDTVRITFTGTETIATGLYPITIQTNSTSGNQSLEFNLTVLSTTPPVVNITSPLNGEDNIATYPQLTWDAPGGAAHTYEVRVATDPTFTNIVASAANLTTPSFVATALNPYSIYYWQVKATNQCAIGEWGAFSSFRTATSTCETITGGEQKNIISGIVFTYQSDLSVPQDVEITDINVLDATISHQRISDISLALRSPQGTEVELLAQSCTNVNGTAGWVLDFDDAATSTNIICNNNANTILRPVGNLAAFNGENAQGTWKMLISDNVTGSGGSFQTFGLEVCYALPNDNEDPILVNNDTLPVVIGQSAAVTTEFLLSTDIDNSAAELTYTVLMATTKGTLKLNGVDLVIGSTFTQADIDNGSLEYTHTGSEGEIDQFQFDVRDISNGWYGSPVFTIKTGETQGLSTADNPLGIYPNPASTNVNIDFYLSADQDVTIMIFDAIGRLVSEYQYSNAIQGNHIFDLPVNDLAAGNYLIRVASDDFVRTEKVLIVR